MTKWLVRRRWHAAVVTVIVGAGTLGWMWVAAETASGQVAAPAAEPPAVPDVSPVPTETPSATPPPAPTPALATPPPPVRPAAPAHPPAAPPPVAPPPPTPATVDVPWQHQVYNLSCEESSLSMVAAYFGRTVADRDVLTFVGVDRTHYWMGTGGGDPFVDFVGDPNGSEDENTGYGVYWPPIKAAAAHFGAHVNGAGQGVAPPTVYANVKAGGPVIVWVTFDLAVHARGDYVAYDGRTIPYAGPQEHAMVVTGVSDASVRLNDPDRGQYWVSRSRFEAAYGVYGQMAVLFGARGSAPTPTAAPSPSPSATPTPPHAAVEGVAEGCTSSNAPFCPILRERFATPSPA